VLATLREKMAILWGNLEERKSAAAAKGLPYPPGNAATDPDLSNLPFHACIQERYQELKPEDKESEDSPDYITIHSLFGVCIL
jgi:protection-of-telomeres protein 1